MNPVTVPGAGYTGASPVKANPYAVAVEIARAMELEAYAAYRRAFHRHRRANSAVSAGEHDAAVQAWHEAQMARDAAEQRHEDSQQ